MWSQHIPGRALNSQHHGCVHVRGGLKCFSSDVSSGTLSYFSVFSAISRKAALLGCSISVGSGSPVDVINLITHQELCSVEDSNTTLLPTARCEWGQQERRIVPS